MKARILLIDDDTTFLELLEEILKMEGYQVTAIPEAEHITAILIAAMPDVAIIDYRLKDATCESICREIRANDEYRTLPLLIISAWPKTLLKLDSSWYDTFIAKPFDLWDLLACIDGLHHPPRLAG
jgi:DNA-binding response OmpR family regulator